ncbi:hypothetical protein [Janthinobacterium sp. LB2P10]|uniref:hypothetical protein n=1 Tax=Janthinobacterium sp. LB2P10 TaxID=3424194 RepID=UPI003F2311B8
MPRKALLIFLLTVFARRQRPQLQQVAIFEARMASWSTYTPLEICARVLPTSVTSIAAFFCASWLVLRETRWNKTA